MCEIRKEIWTEIRKELWTETKTEILIEIKTEMLIEIKTETWIETLEIEKKSGEETVTTSGTGKEISEIVKGTTQGTVKEIGNGQTLATKTIQETPDLKGLIQQHSSIMQFLNFYHFVYRSPSPRSGPSHSRGRGNREMPEKRPQDSSQPHRDNPPNRNQQQPRQQVPQPGNKLFNIPAEADTTQIEDLLCLPGRVQRPSKFAIFMRGPSGSGKSFAAKLIKDKEVENGGNAPRILSLDDYFMAEVEKEEQDPETGRRVKSKVNNHSSAIKMIVNKMEFCARIQFIMEKVQDFLRKKTPWINLKAKVSDLKRVFPWAF